MNLSIPFVSNLRTVTALQALGHLPSMYVHIDPNISHKALKQVAITAFFQNGRNQLGNIYPIHLWKRVSL